MPDTDQICRVLLVAFFLLAFPSSLSALPQKEEDSTPEMLEEGELSKEVLEELGRKTDFSEAFDASFPLSPEEIRKAKELKDAIDEAESERPAHMRTEARILSPRPSAVPQVIMLTEGYSATIVFQDRTGAPWPVTGMILGNPKAFALLQPGVSNARREGENRREAKGNARENNESSKGNLEELGMHQDEGALSGHIVNIVPLLRRASTNLVVTLEGLSSPLIFQLIAESPKTSSRDIDALILFRVAKKGPKAKTIALVSEEEGKRDSNTLSFLHGMAPEKAKQLKLTPPHSGIRVWEYEGLYYLQSAYPLLWPAFCSAARGESTAVYVLKKTPSFVLAIEGKSRDFALQED